MFINLIIYLNSSLVNFLSTNLHKIQKNSNDFIIQGKKFKNYKLIFKILNLYFLIFVKQCN